MYQTGELRHAVGNLLEVNLWDLGQAILDSGLVTAIRAAGARRRYVVTLYAVVWETIVAGNLVCGLPALVTVIADTNDFAEAQRAFVRASQDRCGAHRDLWRADYGTRRTRADREGRTSDAEALR